MMAMSPTALRGHEESPLLIASASLYDPESYEDTEARFPLVVGKYAVEAVSYQKMETTRRVTSTYGTLTLNQVEEIKHTFVSPSSKKRVALPHEGSPDHAHGSNNQSETESDSDGSCGSSATQPPAIQSILRIRTGDLTTRTLEKKPSSVGFAIDIDETDDEDDEFEGDEKTAQQKRASNARRQSCAARCIPRRLTLEEKAALYRVRPDLELTPMPILLRDVEEQRRRRQRKLVFTMLGGTLIILMMVVMYYVFSQV